MPKSGLAGVSQAGSGASANSSHYGATAPSVTGPRNRRDMGSAEVMRKGKTAESMFSLAQREGAEPPK